MRLITLIQETLPALPDSIPTMKEEVSMLKSMPVDELISRFVSGIVTLAINLLIAVAVFYIGKVVIKKLYKVVHGIMLRRQVDNSLSTFVLSFVRIVLYFILIVIVIGIMGIETSSFIAIFASAGVAIGMALSGTLQNFAGGVLILLLKPYKVGDYIDAQGYAGTVKEIQIFHTIILTPDNKSITIPNGGLSTGSINNYSREDYRRVDWFVSISYGDDVAAARAAIGEILAADSRIVSQYCEDVDPRPSTPDPQPSSAPAPKRSFFSRLFRRHREKVEQWQQKRESELAALNPKPDRSPIVLLDSLGDSAVRLQVRAWVKSADYWDVFFEVNEKIYEDLPKKGLHFPFPQLDIHYSPSPASPHSHQSNNTAL